MVLPSASLGGLYALALVFAFQVLPRPWIGQMTNLLVSQLYDDASLSSAAQSFNQGGFALGCVFMVLLEELSSPFGGEAMFYIAGAFTGLSSLLFLTLPSADSADDQGKKVNTSKTSKTEEEDSKPKLHNPASPEYVRMPLMPSAFTLSCSCLGILAVGLEVACGTWLITTMLQLGFASPLPSLCNIVFWALFAVSRLVIAPCICKFCRLKPSSMIVGGASMASLACISASVWPTELPALLLGVSGVAVGVGPSYAMCITMAKERRELTSVDSAMFAVASSLGAGGVPFVMSRILSRFGPQAFFPTLLGMSVALVVLATLLHSISGGRQIQQAERKLRELRAFVEDEDSSDSTYNASFVLDTSDRSETLETETFENLEVSSKEEEPDMPVPPVIWTYWEQGWQHAPLVCQICVESWELSNPELTLHKVSAMDLPALLPDLCRWDRLWELPAGQRSDLVRLALLEKFGGIWVDATLFSSAPIMPWLDGLKQKRQHSPTEQNERNESESNDSNGFFFVFERDSGSWPYDPFVKCKLPISSWFIASTPNHPITSKWFSCLCREVLSSSISYFVIHDTFRKLLEEDAETSKFYNEVPKVSARHPHLLEFELNFSSSGSSRTPSDTSQLTKNLEIAPMQKLSHKVLHDPLLLALINPNLEPTLLGILFSQSRLAKDLAHSHDFSDAWGRSELASVEQQRKALMYSSWQFSLDVHPSNSVDVTMIHSTQFSADER